MFLKKIQSLFEKGIDTLVIVLFIIIFLSGLLQIFFRWILKSPLVWSEELIRLMFVWICYLGWVLASKNGSHIKITFLIEKFSSLTKKIFNTVNCLLIILFSFLMVRYGIDMTIIGVSGRAVTLPVNFALIYIICPISNFIIICYQIAHMVSLWRAEKEVVV